MTLENRGLEKLRLFEGSRVFIGLRPRIFEKVENEHITLEYLGSFVEWNYLIEKCEEWKQRFGGMPVAIEVNGYANWYNSNNGKDRYSDVALVGFKDYPELTFQKNWHITLDKSDRPLKARQFDKDADAFRYDVCDTLWVGYKDMNGESQWLNYDRRPLKISEALWEK